MIVSHKHKFIFIAIPKTATHAIRFALRPHLGNEDWEQVDLFHKSRLPFNDFKNINHGHISAIEAKKVLGEEVWDNYFKFSFVRNPYDRFVSYAFFKKGKSLIFKKNKIEVMKLMLKNPNISKDLLFKPQLDFLQDLDGNLMLDFVGSFENIQRDFNIICDKLNIQKTVLKVYNSSNHRNYLNYLDEELSTQIENHFRKDIEYFKYSS